MMDNVTLKNSPSQQESVYLTRIYWLLRIGKKISTSFQILPGTMSDITLSKCQVCIQKNE